MTRHSPYIEYYDPAPGDLITLVDARAKASGRLMLLVVAVTQDVMTVMYLRDPRRSFSGVLFETIATSRICDSDQVKVASLQRAYLRHEDQDLGAEAPHP